MLKMDKIQKRITECLNELMTNEFVDSQLMKVIVQNDEKSSKIAGIREFNKLKQRILDRQDITSGGEPANIIGIEYIVPKKLN